MSKHEEKRLPELAILGGSPVRPEPIAATVVISDKLRKNVQELLNSGVLSCYYNGLWARRFEEEFARYLGPGHFAVAVNSGTSALQLAVEAAGIGQGDEVIMPALCFVAAALAVVNVGAIPIICDSEADSLTLNVSDVESLIGPHTKGILPVHFWGHPANMAMLREICDRHKLVLIEDCAQAFGASVQNAKTGNYGDYAAFAFSVRKHIACGEGGIVLCRNEENYNRLRCISNYGKGPDWHDYRSPGHSYRMAEFPAIVALDGLGRLDEEIRRRQQAARHYLSIIEGTKLEAIATPLWGKSVYFKFPILLPHNAVTKRQHIVDAIKAENVSCRIPHPPLYNIPWLSQYLKERGAYRGASECPIVASHYPRLIEIETGPHLPLEEAVKSGTAVLKVWNHYSAEKNDEP